MAVFVLLALAAPLLPSAMRCFWTAAGHCGSEWELALPDPDDVPLLVPDSKKWPHRRPVAPTVVLGGPSRDGVGDDDSVAERLPDPPVTVSAGEEIPPLACCRSHRAGDDDGPFHENDLSGVPGW
jgi:hypothetical protein